MIRKLARRLIRTPFSRRISALLHSISTRIDAANAHLPAHAAVTWTVPTMPSWVEDELLELSFLEPELVPPGGDLSKYGFYSVPFDPEPGKAYFELLQQAGASRYTHVFLIPWLKQGGADRGIIYHVKAIAEAMPDARILVVATENADSPWAEKLPGNATYIGFGKIAGHLAFEKQVAVLVRLMVQLQPPMIHLVNSRVGWEMVRQYALALKQNSVLYASLFCDDYDARMMPVGYARVYLRDCYQAFETIFCDNSRYPDIWSRELGVSRSAFTVLPFPYDGDIAKIPATAISRQGAGHVLWAGRLDRQKRPDVLAKIAVRMPDVHFDVYGAAVMSHAGDDSVALLSGLPNVTLHGEFKRLEEVASPEHFAYLHTTAWEGTPTILFDVAAAGLPICAPAIGGIVDFIANDHLVQGHEDVDAFVDRLMLLRGSAKERNMAVSRQAESMKQQRTWAAFLDNLNGATCYISSEA